MNRYKSKQEYDLDHSVCPKCGCYTSHYKTNFVYIFSRVREFKDENLVKCNVCRWNGIVNDLLPELKKIENNYYFEHEACPSCKKKTNLVQTLVGIPFIPEYGKIWKDTNSCACSCGWCGIVDDLVKE